MKRLLGLNFRGSRRSLFIKKVKGTMPARCAAPHRSNDEHLRTHHTVTKADPSVRQADASILMALSAILHRILDWR